MLANAVYQLEGEVDRLATQTRLFEPCETPVYQRILSQYSHATILDVGCNNGHKAICRFSGDGVAKVVGLEYHASLAVHPQDDRFVFYGCDVERPDFPAQLQAIMAEQSIPAFDVIHISLVLLHLQQPEQLLRTLRSVLSPQGQLLIVEAADQLTHLHPDPTGLCQGFVTALSADPYGGNRGFVDTLPNLLADCGYDHIVLAPQTLTANPEEVSKKQDIFDIFCSFVEEDAHLMEQPAPWTQWVSAHWEAFHDGMTHPDSQITVGFTLLTCTPIAFYLSPMERHEIPEVCQLFDQCAGENLYTPDFVEAMFGLPNHYFNLLRTPNGQIAGYSYSNVADLATVADYAKLPLSLLKAIPSDGSGKLLNLQATGVAAKYRKLHLSEYIIDCVLKTVAPNTMAFGLCWRPCNKAPEEKTAMENTLLAHDFVFLAQSFDVWADVTDLVCPYCRGICHCSATAYYRPIPSQGGPSIEAETTA